MEKGGGIPRCFIAGVCHNRFHFLEHIGKYLTVMHGARSDLDAKNKIVLITRYRGGIGKSIVLSRLYGIQLRKSTLSYFCHTFPLS